MTGLAEEAGIATPEAAVPSRPPGLGAVMAVSVADLPSTPLPTAPAAPVLVLPDAASPPLPDAAATPGPDAFLVAPGPRAAAWWAACRVAGSPAVDRATTPVGCLLAADGLVAPAAALADVVGRRGLRPRSGSAGLIALAYALSEAGWVPHATSTTGNGRATDDPPAAVTAQDLAALARDVPVLRSLRAVTGRRWDAPVLHVVIHEERHDDDALRVVTDRWLSASVADLVVSLPRRLPEYDDDPRVRAADDRPAPTAPYVLRWPASLAPGPQTAAGLLDLAMRHGSGLLRVRTPGRGETPVLTRTAVVERLARVGVVEPRAADFEVAAGTWWADGDHLGIAATEGLSAGSPTGDRRTSRAFRRRRWRPRGGS